MKGPDAWLGAWGRPRTRDQWRGARHSSPGDGEHFHGQVSGILADKCLPLRLVRPLLKAWSAICEQLLSVDKEALAIAAQDDTFQRMISVPGGAITALAFKPTIDHSWRFSSYANVGAHLGLAPRCYASGETDRAGRISKCGDGWCSPIRSRPPGCC